MKRDRETQKYCRLLNKVHCFTIYYQNKIHEIDKTFEIEKKRNLRGHYFRYTALPLTTIKRRYNFAFSIFFFTSFIKFFFLNFFYCYLKVHIYLFYCYLINISLTA